VEEDNFISLDSSMEQKRIKDFKSKKLLGKVEPNLSQGSRNPTNLKELPQYRTVL